MGDASSTGASEGTATVGAASLHWRREGRGPAVVLLHGFPLSGRTWDGVVAQLRDRFTCHAFDLIGLGQSHSSAGADYSSPGQARAFQGLLAQLRVESYALVGNDTGGWIARELALIDAPRVARLVLTNTEIPRHRPPWIPTYQRLARLPGYGAVMQQVLGWRSFRRSPLGFGGCFHDLRTLDGDFHERFVEPLITSRARIDGAMEFLRRMEFGRLDEFETLHRQLGMPTLFLWGANDPTFPEPRAREMAHQFPNVAGFHAVRDAKLFLHEEHPAEVAGAIARFLS
jgi:pimeloyl-ACP methyl ester carboxylesterase